MGCLKSKYKGVRSDAGTGQISQPLMDNHSETSSSSEDTASVTDDSIGSLSTLLVEDPSQSSSSSCLEVSSQESKAASELIDLCMNAEDEAGRKAITNWLDSNPTHNINTAGTLENGHYTPLLWAVQCDVPETVSLLLDRGADVNVKSVNSGTTPLHFAAARGLNATVDVLIQRGADINAEGFKNSISYKRTPLHAAVEMGHAATAALLLDSGADIHAQDLLGLTPLHLAIACHQHPVVMLLVERSADPHIPDKNGQTPAQLAQSFGFGFLIKRRDSTTGKGLLHYAALQGWDDTVELLLDSGADINAEDADGLTALHYAVKRNKSAVASLLVRKGAYTLIDAESGLAPLPQAIGLSMQ